MSRPRNGVAPDDPGGGLCYVREMRTQRQIVDSLVAAKAQRDEDTVRALLGRWVSGAEPAIAYGSDGEIVGLTLAGLHVGCLAPIVVSAR